MIEVTETFKNAARAPVKVLRASITMDDDTVYSSSDNLASITKEDTGYYFGTATGSLTFKLIGTDYNLLGKNLTAKFELQTDSENDTWEECKLGNFHVYDQTVDLEKNTTTIKAYDQIGIMGLTAYETGNLNFNISVENLISQIAEKFNLIYQPTNLPNGDYIVKEDLYAKISTVTYRDILAELAGATATLAIVSGNELQMRPLNNSTAETLTYTNLKKVKLEPMYGPVNSVVLARTPQEDNITITDDASIAEYGLTEVKLANNEVLDDDRESLITPIMAAVDGFLFYPFEATTEAHGWYEIGDRIAITDGTNTWESIITNISLTFSGGFKEIIKGVAPTETKTNYALAGGITKTIYNTEIKVDKQGQEIQSIVSRQDSLESTEVEHYSSVVQDLGSITATIQETGGGNLIYNSVGYDVDNDGKLVDWATAGATSSATSPESISYGAISGNQVNLSSSTKITQRVTVDGSGEQKYTMSVMVKKGSTGAATIRLKNELDDFSITIPTNESVLWKKYDISAFIPSMNYLDIEIETDADVAEFAYTDLVMTIGSSTTPWVQASGETLNTQVAITRNGVKVKSSVYQGDYVEITPLEFAGYSTVSGSQQKVFTLNRDTTTVQKLRSEAQIEMPPLKIVPITSGTRAGWAFVKGDN